MFTNQDQEGCLLVVLCHRENGRAGGGEERGIQSCCCSHGEQDLGGLCGFPLAPRQG